MGRMSCSPYSTESGTCSLDQLRLTREAGSAIDDEEQEVGGRCVAAPICAGVIVAAVSVSGPSAHLGPESIGRAVPYGGPRQRELSCA